MATRKKPVVDPAPLPGAGLGRVAYEAHAAALPSRVATRWEHLAHDEAAAWCVAAQAVITATISRKD